MAATPPNTQYSEMPQGTGAASQDASVHQPVLIMQQRLWMWMFMAALSLGGKPVAAQEPAPESPRCTMPDTSAHRLPFSEADNADGARYVRIELADLEKRLGPARFFRRLVPKKP